MNFLGKITGDKKQDQQQNGQQPNAAQQAAQQALQAAQAVMYSPKWSTRMGQCDPPATMEHWLFSCFCTPCAAATAKSRMDGTHVLWNFFCWQPIGSGAWVRKGYRVKQTCGDDLMYGIFCMPCSTRRLYTEVELRKEAPQLRGGPDEWQTTLFACGCCEFFQAVICPFCPASEAKQFMQPDQDKDTCFDWMCTIPFGMYGQVRHMYGIKAEFGMLEDCCLPLFCYPCAIAQANREAQWRLMNTPYVYGASAASGVGQVIAGKMGLGAVM